MVANAAAANGGRSSPSQGPATPSTSTVSTALTSINSSWIVRFVAKRDARTPTATTANTTPAPISTNSSCTAYGGKCASQRRNPPAAMIASAALPLVEGQRFVGRIGFSDAGVGPVGGGVLGAELRQALLLGRQGGLEGVGKLGVVHGDHPQPGLQLDHLHLGSGQFEIDRFCHFFL